ncbi:MAG TPA: translocation/assembly module TamB domain-containing protein [Armatimonadota bacterium]|jgi:hypothetical protein
MKLRPVLRIILVLVVVGMVLAIGLALWATRPEYLQARARDVLAQVLAEQVAREVQIGTVGGNLLTGITIENLAVGGEKGLQNGAAISAQHVRITFDLPALLARRVALAACVKRIDLDRAYVLLDLSAKGKLSLSSLFKPRAAKRPPPEQRFQPLIVMTDSVVDLSVPGANKSKIATRLSPVRASVKLNALGPMQISVVAGSAEQSFEQLNVQALDDEDERAVLIHGAVTGLQLSRWGRTLPANSKVRVSAGRADASFNYWMVPASGSTVGPLLATLAPDEQPPKMKRETGYSVQVSLTQTELGLPASAGGSLAISAADLSLTPQGVEIGSLDGRWAGAPVHAQGWVYNLSKPRADVHLTAAGVDLADLRRRLPAATSARLGLDLAGSGNLQVDATGPLDHLGATIAFTMPHGGLLTTAQTGEVALGTVQLNATLFDVSKPVVTATLSSSSAGVSAAWVKAQVKRATPVGVTPPLVTLRDVTGLRASVVYAGGTPLVDGSLSSGGASYQGLQLANFKTSFAWSGRLVSLRQAQATALGGTLAGDVLVSLPAKGGSAQIVANGRMRDVNLAQVPQKLWKRPAGASGQASGEVGVVWQGKSGQAVASLDLRRVVYADYRFDQAQTLLSANLSSGGNWSAEVPLARLEGPGMHVWASGTASRDGPLNLQVDLGGVNLAALPRAALPPKATPPAGRVYARAHLTGTWKKPEVQGELAAFDVKYNDFTAKALALSFNERPLSLALKDLIPPRDGQIEGFASYDTAVARVALALSPPAAAEEAPALSGSVRLVGLRLAAAHELLGKQWPTDLKVEGMAEADVTLSGTTLAPVADGEATLSDLQYQQYYVNSVLAPFHFELSPENDDYLTVHNGLVRAHGAQVSFDGVLHDLFGDWNYVIEAHGAGARLERLAAFQPVNVPMSGEVSLPQLVLRGSAKGLTGEGRLVAETITVGDTEIKGLDTHFIADADQVRLERTSLEAAGGRLQAELVFARATRVLTGEVEAAGVDVSSVLRLIGPLAASQAQTTPAYQAQLQRWMQWAVRAQGEADMTVRLSGPLNALQAGTTFALRRASYENKPLPDAKGSLLINVAERSAHNLNAELQMGQALMTVQGDAQLDGPLSVVADASNVDLAMLRDWVPADLGMGGVAGVTIQAKGTTQQPEITASVDVLSASLRGVSFDLLSVPVVTIAQRGIDFDQVILKRGDREITGSGHLPFTWEHPLKLPGDQPISLAARVDNTDLGFFPPIIDELARYTRHDDTAHTMWGDMSASGIVNSQLALTGTLDKPALEGFVRLAKGAVSRPGWRQSLSDLSTDVSVQSVGGTNAVSVSDISGRWDQTRFQIGGHASLISTKLDELAKNLYDLTLTVEAGHQVLWTGQALDDLKGKVTLTNSPSGRPVLTVADLGGKLGAGTVQVNGTVGLSSFLRSQMANNDWNLHLDTKQAELSYPSVLKGTLDGALQVTSPTPGQPALISGKLLLDPATLGLIQWAGPSTGQLMAPGARFPDFGFNVTVAVGKKVQLRAGGLQTLLQPTAEALVLTGSAQAPDVHGGAAAVPNSGSLPGTDFNVRSLSFTYSIKPVETPRLNPSAPPPRGPRMLALKLNYTGLADQTLSTASVDGRNIGPVHLVMDIRGGLPARTPQEQTVITLSSEPPLTQDQIRALVGLGAFGTSGTTDVNQVLSQRFGSLLAGGLRAALFSPIEEEFRRSLGLSEFTVAFTFDQPFEIRMGKYLVDNFLVNYHYTLVGQRTAKWDLGVSYDLPKNLRATYATNESGDHQFRIGRSWGF